MSACLLLDPLQLYLEMSVFIGLSICTANANSCTVGNANVVLWLFWVEGGGGENFNKEVGL